MSDAENFLEPPGMAINPQTNAVEGHTDEDFDLAIRILKQFEPKDQSQLFELASKYGTWGGMALTGTFVFWWLLVYGSDDNMSVGTSVFFGFNFSQVALVVLILCTLSTILADASRVGGSFMLSPISGGMLILCMLYIAEPLAASVIFGKYDASVGLWRSVRLGILWSGARIGSVLFGLSVKLGWVKKFCEKWGYEMNSLATTEFSSDSKA